MLFLKKEFLLILLKINLFNLAFFSISLNSFFNFFIFYTYVIAIVFHNLIKPSKLYLSNYASKSIYLSLRLCFFLKKSHCNWLFFSQLKWLFSVAHLYLFSLNRIQRCFRLVICVIYLLLYLFFMHLVTWDLSVLNGTKNWLVSFPK